MKKLLTTLLVVLFAFSLVAEEKKKEFDIVERSIMMPKEYRFKEMNWMFGFGFAKVPFDWVEMALQAPLFYLHGNLGLPYGFVANLDVQTLFVSNQFRLGLKWNKQFGRFSAGVGYDQAFMFGRMNFLGFANRVTGWTAYPNVSAGFVLSKNIAFTLNAEFPVITHMRRTAGEIETSTDRNAFVGPTVSLFMEQRLYKNHILILGVKNSFTKYFFPAWMAFSTFNRYYYVPELFCGFKL